VDDGVVGAGQGLVGPLDQVGPALDEHLDGDVVGDEILVDEQADEVVVRLRGRREADLDLLEAHLHEHVEHAPLAPGVHRVDQGLVAVAKVNAAPARSLGDASGRPLPIGQIERQKGTVLLERHAPDGAGLGRHWDGPFSSTETGERKNLPARGHRRFGEHREVALAYIRRRRLVGAGMPSSVPG
jgi:hypothetical protein